MLKQLKVSRRFALRGALSGVGVALWLPVLEAMCNSNGTAFAQGQPLPTSFGIFFWGNGGNLPDWTPTTTGTGNAWTLSKNLAAFAPVKDAMTLVTGLNMLNGHFKGHGWGALYVLAGGDGDMPATCEQINNAINKGETEKATQLLPTIDQLIARDSAITGGYPFKSLETGVLPYKGKAMGTVSQAIAHRGPNDPLLPEYDPKALFDRLFNGGASGGGMPSDLSAKLRKSVLDAVLEDAKRLKMSLGAEDSRRLDGHMESIAAIEKRIVPAGNPPTGGTCTKPTAPAAPVDMTQRSQALNRLLAAAVACNLTRVFTHLWSGARDDNTYPTIGIDAEHHSLTHDGKKVEHSTIERYIMSQYADMAIAMKETPMGAGNVLDNTLIYGISDVSQPGGHLMKDFQIVLMGHAGGKLPGNRHIRFNPDFDGGAGQRRVTELMLTMMQVMGLKIDTFGSWDKTSKTVPELWT